MSTNKTNIAVVTGANKGLGFAIVKGLCGKFEGLVYLTSRDERRGIDACEELKKLGLSPVFHLLDVTDENSISRFCANIREKNEEIAILVNNAGVLYLKDAAEPKGRQAEHTILVNFFAIVNFCEAVLPLVKHGGSIVNISSSSGHLSRIPSEELRNKFSSLELSLEGLTELMKSYVDAVKKDWEIEEGWGDSPYVVSKVGVNAYTFMLHRRLLHRDIKVNCVHPGYVISDMTRGAGNVTPAQAAVGALKLALEPRAGGQYVWHDGTAVPWDGPDPRGYIDGKTM